ncbi:MAG: hypothetical protein FWG83_01935 [Oscillospiraceae bacterium]|nr:hypothetical protein [Oscillospiraceae bacterium]
MLNQVSVFVENKPGRVHSVMETLAQGEINVRAMTIAETSEFGIIRLVVNAPEKAKILLREGGFTVKITELLGIAIPDKFGALRDVVKLLGENGINIEYSYSLMSSEPGEANIAIRVKDREKASVILSGAGVKTIQ